MRFYQMQSMIFTFYFAKENVQMKLRLVGVDDKYYMLLIFENISDKMKLSDTNSKLNYSYMLINSLSHELYTPLHQILMTSKEVVAYIEREGDDKQSMKGEIMKINQISLGLFFTVKNLIDYANIINNSFDLNLTRFSLRQVFDYIISAFSIKARRKGIILYADCDKSIEVYTDYERLAGLLFIFVDNSIKFTDKGGISLSAIREMDGRVTIKVIDTGQGIAKRDLTVISQIIMNPFLEDRTTNSPGLGIGLRMAKDILRKLTSGDGSIEIKSEKDVGTTVQFELLQAQEKNIPGSESNPTNEVVVNTQLDLESEKQKEFRKERNNLLPGIAMALFSQAKISPITRQKKHDDMLHSPSPNAMLDKIEEEQQPDSDEEKPHKESQNLIDCREYDYQRPIFITGKLSTRGRRDTEKFEIPESSVVVEEKMVYPNIGNRKCAIVVDDDIFNSDIAKNMLNFMGIEAHQASSGDAAIAICEEFLEHNKKVHLILMDYNMPGKCGDETTRILREPRFDPILKDIPIIGVTAQPDQKTKNICLESGMNFVESKPFDFNRMKQLLQKYKITE